MKSAILSIYKKHHSGRENAITRDRFLMRYFPISDRHFRNAYSQLPICTCDKGGFYPIRKEEIEDFREYMKKKAIPHFERFNRVRDAHPELTGEIKQLGLFDGIPEDGHLNHVSFECFPQRGGKNDK